MNSNKKEITKIINTFLISSEEKNENTEEKVKKVKKSEIETFIAELETIQNTGISSLSFINQKKQELSVLQEKENSKIEQTFKNILENLEFCKKKIFEKIKTSHDEMATMINHYYTQVSNSLKDMNYMHSDISQNVNNIIVNMERKPFDIILKKYQQKLKSYEIIYQNVQKESIFQNFLQINLKNFQNKSYKIEEEMLKIINSYFKNNLFDTGNTDDKKKDVYVSFDDKELFEKSPFYHENKSDNKSFEKIMNTSVSDKENINSPNTQKYIELLQKVSNNQENNTIFFNNIMKNTPLKSSESCKVIKTMNEFVSDKTDFKKLLGKFEKNNLDTSEISNNSINAYQKNLFNSPSFKYHGNS